MGERQEGMGQYKINKKKFGSAPIGIWKIEDFVSLTNKELSSILFAIVYESRPEGFMVNFP